MKISRKGFTLAELLIVVAIIAVLVAVAIPVFGSQLEKSREAADLANVRAAYAKVLTEANMGIYNEPVTVKATLLQDGKVQEVKEQIFSCGNQEMLIPVKKIVSGNFELQLSAGEHQDNLQLTAEEDAFSE